MCLYEATDSVRPQAPYYYYHKKEKQYLWQRMNISPWKEETKVSSGIGKVLTKYKTSFDFYAF